jgi:hypothetical protein
MKSATIIPMLLFAAPGIIMTAVYWHGLAAWWHFCRLPLAQVKGTPNEAMWTSLRGATGVLFLMMVLMWAATVWRCKRGQSKNSSN